MGTATNQIANYGDIDSLAGYSITGNSNQCPSKTNIESHYSNVTVGGSYNDNQCVKYSDLSASAWITMTFVIKNRTNYELFLNIMTAHAAEIFNGTISPKSSVETTAQWHIGDDYIMSVIDQTGQMSSWQYTYNESRAICEITIY